MVDQCTTSDSAVTAPDRPSSASTPATAGLPASATHFGTPDAANSRRPDLRPDAR